MEEIDDNNDYKNIIIKYVERTLDDYFKHRARRVSERLRHDDCRPTVFIRVIEPGVAVAACTAARTRTNSATQSRDYNIIKYYCIIISLYWHNIGLCIMIFTKKKNTFLTQIGVES